VSISERDGLRLVSIISDLIEQIRTLQIRVAALEEGWRSQATRSGQKADA